MCGIAGYLTVKQDTYPASVLERMNRAQEHRGPDAAGYFREPHVALAHRRLSIIDLAAGAQPMGNEDGARQIIYNGEIFNHAAVRPALEERGHRYRTRCDTETILHAYEEWGPAALDRFRGMFAFVIWDGPARTLFAARDRLGIKPFYYFWDGKVFAFASEIKSLLTHPAVPTDLETGVLAEYFSLGYVSSERTLFRGIRQLLPGHWLRIDLKDAAPAPRIQRYWDVPPAQTAAPREDADWIAECRRRLEETVSMRLMSDVPLGMFLSGGVDSSAITALAQRELTGKVRTFAVGYAEDAYSELDYARQAAAHLGTEHREVGVGAEEFFAALPRLIWHEDKPIVWPSSVALHFVSRLAREHVTVVLTGEGSDELFGGYGRYATYLNNRVWMDRYAVLPNAWRDLVRRTVETAPLPGALRRKLLHTPIGRQDSVSSLHFDNFYAAFTAAEQATLFPDFAGRENLYENCLGYWDRAAGRSALGQLLYTDQKTYLVELLMKQDRMSMSCSIESRVPLLDHTLVEFAARVPDHLKIRRGTAKYIFKEAVADLLPAGIVHRRKMGFPTPLEQWLRGPHAEPVFATLRKPDGMLRQIADRTALDDLIHKHREGSVDATDRLWRLLTFQIWADVFLLNGLDPADPFSDAYSLGQSKLSASHY